MKKILWVVALAWATVACGDPVEYEDPEEIPQYSYLLIEDQQNFRLGENPGADIDAVALYKASGDVFFARVVMENTVIPTENSVSTVATRAQGAPDAVEPDTGVCYQGGRLDHSTFVSLNGGRLVMVFGEEGQEVAIEEGDQIHVFELDPSECNRFDEDPFFLSVSTEPDGTFVQLGELHEGPNRVEVGPLP